MADRLIRLYNDVGTLGHMSKLFTDGGAKVIATIDDIVKADTEVDVEEMETTTPQSKAPSVKVGDVYEANGKTYTITSRENGRTTYTITDKDGNATQREASNVVVDINFTKEDSYATTVKF